jgi:hypothetical protein
MLGLVLSVGVLAGLVAVLVVLARRRDRADRRRLGLDLAAKPDPELVDRAFDPSLCAFCDEPRRHECRACTRPTCDEHRPWPAQVFCYPCEAEWLRGTRRRALIITPIVLGSMVAIALATVGIGFAIDLDGGGTLALGAIAAPILIAAPIYAALERRLRRRFRPTGSLPRATQR